VEHVAATAEGTSCMSSGIDAELHGFRVNGF
jgi:hypothetical protein